MQLNKVAISQSCNHLFKVVSYMIVIIIIIIIIAHTMGVLFVPEPVYTHTHART